ncbi:MAG: DmsE family decaheme c-type cytochrome [Pseudomonadota bacterium]
MLLISERGFGADMEAPPGAMVCRGCHLERYVSYALTRHSMESDPRTPAAQGGCVACHSGGWAHVNAGGGRGVGGIVNPASKELSPEKANAVCLNCHEGGKRMEWSLSKHANRDLKCITCHQVHNMRGRDPVRERATQAQVCISCHKDRRAQINLPHRHPIPEGKVACSDCHNPHGSAGPSMMARDSVNETCYTCHMEKRGPFIHTHQPVQEDCSTCHDPHGTTNPALLKIRVPFLCQSCHEPGNHQHNLAQLGGDFWSNNFEARGCLNCHTQIHGTNNPSPSIVNRWLWR